MNKNRDIDLSPRIVIGALCFIIGFGLIAFLLYILPHLMFGWQYDVPYVIHQLDYYLQTQHGLQGYLKLLTFIVPMVLLAIFLFIIAKVLTDTDEKSHRRGDAKTNPNAPVVEFSESGEETKRETNRDMSKTYLVLIIGIAIFIIVEFFVFYSGY